MARSGISRNRIWAAPLSAAALLLLTACDLTGAGEDSTQDPQSPEIASASNWPEIGIGEVAHRNLAGGDGLTEVEFEPLLLNSRPAVEPGMAMSEVLDRMVFSDQLLDPTPPSDFGVAVAAVHSAIEELTRAGSVRFSLSSQASDGCISGNYGPAVYEIGELDDAPYAISQLQIPGFVRFALGNQEFVLDRGANAFRRSGDQWLRTTAQDVHRATGWWEWQSGLFSLLERLLKVDDPQDLTVTFEPGGRVTIRSVIATDIAARTMTLSIDPASNQIQRFSNQTNVYGICQSLSSATLAEYGVTLIAIAGRS